MTGEGLDTAWAQRGRFQSGLKTGLSRTKMVCCLRQHIKWCDSLFFCGLGVFELFQEFCSLSDSEFRRNSGLWKGKLGVFERNFLFCSLLPMFRIVYRVTKREQKSGKGRKTPKWQIGRAGKPKFFCPAGEQILKKPRKTPTTLFSGSVH